MSGRIFLGLLVVAVFADDQIEKDWMIGPFTKDLQEGANPVLEPDGTTRFHCPIRQEKVAWEAKDVFNPAAVIKDGKVHLLYRAEDVVGALAGTSRVGLAISEDGIHFKREPEPVLYPDDDFMEVMERDGGIEDPRVVEAEDGTYVMTYTSYNGLARLCIATSPDLYTWTKHGPAFLHAYDGRYRDSWTKSGSIVCRLTDDGRCVATRINGQYWMYWGEYHIHAAVSDDLISWTPILSSSDGHDVTRTQGRAPRMPTQYRRTLKSLFTPRAGRFDSELVEPGPPALLTDRGIVFIYNSKNKWCNGPDGECQVGVNDHTIAPGTYSAGQVLFDAQDPTKVLDRTRGSFLRPDQPFEVDGQVNNVCFAEGLVLLHGKWFLYYGTADSKIAVATAEAKASDLFTYAQNDGQGDEL